MPVIQIRALPQKSFVSIETTLKRLCAEVAPCLGTKPQSVFATFTPVDFAHYVEGDKKAASQPEGTHPPIIDVIAFEGRTPEQIESALVTIAKVICESFKLAPGNVFITYHEGKSGQIYTGGSVRKRSTPTPPPLPS